MDPSFLLSFSIYLNSYNTLGTVLGTGDRAVDTIQRQATPLTSWNTHYCGQKELLELLNLWSLKNLRILELRYTEAQETLRWF